MMNRRDLLAGASAAIPAAAIKKSSGGGKTDRARVAWVAYCRAVGENNPERRSSVEEYCAQQMAKGRDVVGIIEWQNDSSLVVIEVEKPSMLDALAFIVNFNESCTSGDRGAHEREYGCVRGICAVGPCQVFDPMAFSQLKVADERNGYQRRQAAELEELRGELKELRSLVTPLG